LAERIAVYCYEAGPEGTRWSFAPVKPTGYAGSDEPKGANPLGDDLSEPSSPEPAGHLEAPSGTRIASVEPPVLDIPGHGQIDVLAVIGASDGKADDLGHLVRWKPRG
jgi:hypothetical protein